MKSIESNTPKNIWKKFWYFFWKDDTIWGWLFSLAIIIIFIKFIFFPTLNFVTGTSLPLAIVESCSMYHEGNLLSNYNNWYNSHESKYNEFDITQDEFSNFKFKNGFNKGDILLIFGANTKKLKEGDVIIFQANQANPIIHRIINIETDEKTGKRTFATIGDNNNGQLVFEKNIQENQIIGKAVFKLLPYGGWGKLIFFEFRKTPDQKGFCNQN